MAGRRPVAVWFSLFGSEFKRVRHHPRLLHRLDPRIMEEVGDWAQFRCVLDPANQRQFEAEDGSGFRGLGQ